MSAKMKLSFTAVLFLSVFFVFEGFSQATPQFAAMSNAKCIACHINAQGGGHRNFRGWSYMSTTGLLVPKQFKDNNGFLPRPQSKNGRISFGADIRYQVARSHKSKDAQRRKFWMQRTVYSDLKLTKWAFVEGSYNFVQQEYSNLQKANVAAVIQPQNSYTQIKAGYFHPSIGLRYDDHTMLVRQVPQADYSNYIPLDYSEYGAEITYDDIGWLTLVAGVFDTKNLRKENFTGRYSEDPLFKIKPITHDNLRLGKVIFHSPDLAGGRVNLHLGGSYYGNNSFEIADIFGWGRFTERVAFNMGFTRTVRPGYRATDNFLAGISIRAFSWVVLNARSENGRTYTTNGLKDIKTYAKQTVLGAQIFVIPHVEIRPEYRIIDTERYKSSRWALQAHLFI